MIGKMLKKSAKFPVRLFRRRVAQFSLRRLTSHDSSRLRAVGNALFESLAKIVSDEEQEWIASIEQRRFSLLSSDRQIAVIGYGAGRPGSNRTEEEMKEGIHSVALVSDICTASKSPFWAGFLLKLIRKLEPGSCVELGACLGISAAYQAVALKINGKGRLLTLEGSPEIAKIAGETLEGLSLRNASVVTGPFHETLKEALESEAPIDFFFNDGHHDHDAVIRYFDQALPYLSDKAVIVFDDITWSSGMKKAWAEIGEHERVAASIDLRTMGIAVVGDETKAKEKFGIPL